MALSERHFTRVAVVQLDVHPAAVVERRTPLEDPLFEFGKPDSLLPTDGSLPPVFKDRYPLLRQRIRQVYATQVKAKVLAVLEACRQWKVRIVVFPEYSIPDTSSARFRMRRARWSSSRARMRSSATG